MNPASEITMLRRQILTMVAQWALNKTNDGRTIEEIVKEMVLKIIPDGPARYRCCIHKERAVVEERINIAMGQASDGEPVITVVPDACNGCSLNKYVVTDACQNCVAHPCRNSCPKKAISVVQNRAYINDKNCVECGICARNCPYHAIIELSRPCERSCAVGAISFGTDRVIKISDEKCVACGLCVTVCPFGAITDTSAMVSVIDCLEKPHPVVAIVAPSIAGQFGAKATPSHIKGALLQLGFTAVVEAAMGADLVAQQEAQEIKDHFTSKFLTNSCCPAHAKAVQVKLPQLVDKVSSTLSPMLVTGQLVKEQYQDSVTTVFIGPCMAKKAEAQGRSEIDHVLTFEELAALFEATGIIPADSVPADINDATSYGRLFAKGGGVSAAVTRHLGSSPVKVFKAEGLRECITTLRQGMKETSDDNFVFVECMACEGGCVGGPGTLVKPNIAARAVERYAGPKDH